MSRVFLAEEVRLGRQVVIKLLPPEMGAAVNVERFEREIQLAARLQHPHIVPLLTAGASGDLLYYVMPFISGESLRLKLAREGELPIAEAVRVLREVVDALSYAHRNGVVHRDIKPDNILLSEGHAVITDFGVAKAVSASSGGSLAHLARRRPRHAGLHGAGAGRGRSARRSPRRHLRRRGAGVRDAHRPAAVHRADARRRCSRRRSPRRRSQLVQHRRTVPPGLNMVVMRCLEKRAGRPLAERRRDDPAARRDEHAEQRDDAGDGADRDLHRHREGHPPRASAPRRGPLCRRVAGGHRHRLAAGGAAWGCPTGCSTARWPPADRPARSC